MSGAGLFQLVAALSSSWRSRVAARALPGRRVRRRGPTARRPGDRVFAPIERLIYRVLRVDPRREQRWNVYAISLLAFSVVSFLAVYVLQRFQEHAAVQPDDMAGVAPLGAFNIAVSFMTNTNWQWYAGELTMGHLTQMVGLAVQNFVSAAVGMAVVVAIIRGIIRRGPAHARQLLGRPRPARRCGSCCRSRSSSPSCSRSAASCRTSTATPRPRRSTPAVAAETASQ